MEGSNLASVGVFARGIFEENQEGNDPMSMVRIDVDYEGDLHTHAVHGPSGAELSTDAPVDNQGRGESYSPTALLATAFGCCMMTIMGIVAQREGWALEGTRIEVEKHMKEEPRRVAKLVARFRVPSGLPEKAHTVLANAARTCPVAQSIHPDIELDVSFDWGS